MAKYEIPDYAFDEITEYIDGLTRDMEDCEQGSIKDISALAEQVGALRVLRKLGFCATFKRTSTVQTVAFCERMPEEAE